MKNKNKVEIKKFLGIADVRIVNEEWIVLKDMFNAIGRVKSDGTWTDEKKKTLQFLEDLDKESDHETLVVSSKGKKQSREEQEMDCLRLSTAPIVLTQFRPTARKGKDVLKQWCEFMKFVNELLESLEVYKYIVVDKEKQLSHQEIISELGGKPMLENISVNRIMGKLILGEDNYFPIKKEELKLYQNQTTIDLLEVRDYVMTKFEIGYEVMESHKSAEDFAYKQALKKYPLQLQ